MIIMTFTISIERDNIKSYSHPCNSMTIQLWMLARPAPHSKANIISIREEEIQPFLDEQVCLPISTILVLACILI
jgi:hypothetical protein